MKKVLLIALVAFLCVAIGIGATLAFGTKELKTDNIITTGKIKAKVISKTLNDKKEEVDFDGENIVTVPGKTQAWKLSVLNDGDRDAYVRVRIVKTITNGKEQLDSSLLVFNVDEESWEYKNGYYYYKKALAPNVETPLLFDGVKLDENAANTYQESIASATIEVETTQVANNGATPLEAQGWPGKVQPD